jgi:MFS family permease
VVGLVALVAAFAFERRAVSPLVPAALFRTRGYLTGTAVITISYASAGAMVFAIPIVLSMADGLSPISIGAIMLSYGVWWLVLPPFTGRLADRVSPVVMLTVGFASGLAGCLLATLVPSLQGIFGACCALALLGIGMALVVPTANRMTMLNIGAPLRGEAS